LVENQLFSPTHLHLALTEVSGHPIQISQLSLLSENENLCAIYAFVCIILYLIILIDHELLTDGQTDTDLQHIPCIAR